MIWTIARREIASAFRSPLAWLVLAVTQLCIAFQFLVHIELYIDYEPRLRALQEHPGVTRFVIAPTIEIAAALLLLLVPILAMNAWAAERRGALALLLGAPVSSLQVALGKFIGLMTILGAVWAQTALMTLTMLWGGPLDGGLYCAALLALALLIAASAALGLLCATLFEQGAVAAVSAFGLLAALWSIDWQWQPDADGSVLQTLSSATHFRHAARGFLDSADIGYFVVLTVAGIALSAWTVEARRRAL